MARPKPIERTYTYADYLRFPTGERWELLDGIAYAMSPAPTPDHQRCVLGIASQLGDQLKGKRCEAFIAPLDVLLPAQEEADDAVATVVQPDIAVFCDPAQVGPRRARGAPQFIVEVLSPGTSSKDQIEKRRKYQEAGVREFWLLHVGDRLLFINRLVDGRFVADEPRELLGQTEVAVLPGVVVVWDELTARLGPIEP